MKSDRSPLEAHTQAFCYLSHVALYNTANLTVRAGKLGRHAINEYLSFVLMVASYAAGDIESAFKIHHRLNRRGMWLGKTPGKH